MLVINRKKSVLFKIPILRINRLNNNFVITSGTIIDLTGCTGKAIGAMLEF